MKKLLIIGASVLQLPAIKKAKEMGYYVGVIDYDPNAVGIEFADEYFNVSTIDIEGVAETAKTFCPDGIVTLATDMPMRSIAAAASELSLPAISMETAIKTTDKGEMIKAFEECGVAHPWFYIIEDEKALESVENSLSFPCILKPCDNSGSRGVVLCKSKESLKADYVYAKNCSRGGSVIIEEYLEGNEVSVEVIALYGKAHIIQVTDKITTGAPHFVEMGHSQPSRLPENSILEIKKLAADAVRAVGIQNGPAHVEIMLTKDGPKMIELGARLGGDCITTHLTPLSTGVDMVRAVIEIACGAAIDIQPKHSLASAIKFISSETNGTITDISGIENARKVAGVTEVSLTKKVGDTVGDIKSSNDRIGFIIARAQTACEAVKILDTASAFIHIKTN